MKSRVNLKSHPLHPILVAFPIALLTSVVVADVVHLVCGSPLAGLFAMYLAAAGIFAGIVAALPGAVDYFTVVPPKSSARARGTKHALFNIAALALFGIALALRQNPQASYMIFFAFDLAGFVLLSVAGWHGGTLVYRNQIGVDHRYAGAGKWHEENADANSGIPAQRIESLKVNQMMLVHYAGKRIVVARTASGFAAFDDFCSHRGGTLADGSLACDTVQCPWHGSQFDINSGKVISGPAKSDIAVYAMERSGDRFFIRV